MAATSDANARGDQAVTTCFIMVALAALFAILRIYGRVMLVKKPGIDDLLLLCALAFSAALAVLIKAQEQHGLGRHFATLAPGEFPKMLKPFWVSIIVYNLGLTFVKCSILCQFFRFFIDRKARLTCWIVLGAVIAYGLCNTFGSIFACTPVAYFWEKSIANGHCIDLLAFWFSNAAFNILSDLVIIVLPIPVLKSLSIPRKQKYGLIMIFIMGGFGCITSILRLHSVYKVSRSTDITWDNVGAATWSSIELNVGIICACLVTLKPVLGAVFPRLVYNNTSRNYSVELPTNDTANVQRAVEESKSMDIQRVTPSLNRHSNQKTPWEEVEEAWDAGGGRRISKSKDHSYSWSIITS